MTSILWLHLGLSLQNGADPILKGTHGIDGEEDIDVLSLLCLGSTVFNDYLRNTGKGT